MSFFGDRGALLNSTKVGYKYGVSWVVRSALGTAFLLVNLACHSSYQNLQLPTPPGTQSLVFITESDAGLRVFAVDLAAPFELPTLLAQNDVRWFTLAYAETLSALDIPTGELVGVRESPRRRLPLQAATIFERIGGDWSVIDEASDAIKDFHFHATDIALCAEKNGCTIDDGTGPVCQIPCPQFSGPLAPAPPAEPAAPIPVSLSTSSTGFSCREHWSIRASANPPECAPWPALPPRYDCARNRAQFAGDADCGPVGSACPPGDWAEGLPADAIYVRAGAVGGDGSASAPYGNVSDAISNAQNGDTIALSKHVYLESLLIDRSVRIIGACAEETKLDPPAGAVEIVAPNVELRDLTVLDAGIGVLIHGPSQNTRLENVIIDGAMYEGLLAKDGSEVELERVLIRAANPGLAAVTGAKIGGKDVVIRSSALAGYFANATTEVVLEDLIVVPLDADGPTGFSHRGIVVSDGAEVKLSGFFVEIDHGSGFEASQASLSIEDGILLGRPGGDRWSALVLRESSTSIVRTVLDHHATTAVRIEDSPTPNTVHFEDVIIRNTDGTADGYDGFAIRAHSGADVTARRLKIENAREIGFLVHGPRASADLSDLSISTIRPAELGGWGGICLQIVGGANVELERAHIKDCGQSCVFVSCEIPFENGGCPTATTLNFKDVDIEECRPSNNNKAGHGMYIAHQSPASGERLRIRRAYDAGIHGVEPLAFLRDVTIKDMHRSPTTHCGTAITTRGIRALSQFNVTRGRFENLIGAGAYAENPLNVLQLTDVEIKNVSPSNCIGIERGLGVAVTENSETRAERLRIEGSHTIGISAESGGHFFGKEVLVTDTVLDTGIGVRAVSGAHHGMLRLSLENFSIENNRDVAISISDSIAHLDNGLILDHQTGLVLFNGTLDASSGRLRFENNVVNVTQGGP